MDRNISNIERNTITNLLDILSRLLKNIDSSDIIENGTILYSKQFLDQEKGSLYTINNDDISYHLYSPEKTNRFFHLVSYKRFYNTSDIKNVFQYIFSKNNVLILDLIQNDINLLFDEYFPPRNINSDINKYIDELFESINRIVTQMNNLDRLLQSCANKSDDLNNEWNKYYIPLVVFFNNCLMRRGNITYIPLNVHNVLTTLFDSASLFVKNTFKYENIIQYANDQNTLNLFFSLSDEEKLMIINNEKKIASYICREQNINICIYNNVIEMVFYMIIGEIIERDFSNIVKSVLTEDKRTIDITYCNFIDSINNRQVQCSFKNGGIYKYLKILLNPNGRTELINSIINLTFKEKIDGYELHRAANILDDREIMDNILPYLSKYSLRGDLDKNNLPRPITSAMYKTFDDMKKSPGFINLTQEQLYHLERFLGHRLGLTEGDPQTEDEEKHTSYKSRIKIFVLNNIPELIFKVYSKQKDKGYDTFKTRCSNTAYAHAIASYYNLDHLIIPKFGFIELGDNCIIYEEKQKIIQHGQLIEHYYVKYAKNLACAIEQLTRFCCLTGLNDIVWRNLPLLDDDIKILENSIKAVESDDIVQSIRIVLVDLEMMNCVNNSMCGNPNGNCIGLINCVTPELFPIIKQIYDEYNKCSHDTCDRIMRTFKTRKAEYDNGELYYAYLKNKGITEENKFEYIKYDESMIECIFSSDALSCNVKDSIIMINTAKYILIYINDHLGQMKNGDYGKYAKMKNEFSPLKYIRNIRICNIKFPDDDIYDIYHNVTINPENEEEYTQSAINIIGKKLTEHGIIFGYNGTISLLYF